MCNKLHSDSQPIPAEGVGYKIFRSGPPLLPMCSGLSYIEDINGWIKWGIGNIFSKMPTSGFCFFLDIEEARRCLQIWIRETRDSPNWYVIEKINYKRGIGTHQEAEMCDEGAFQIALCKEFQICPRE